LKCPIGDIVGYHIGMLSKISNSTRISYMTYGILIQQLLFNSKIEYTHIILDEVHERSLEMDFTFIALKKILDRQEKKDTKVIIMSATINC
jgi:ATP-dependent RNA helicase TDRD9